MKPSVREYIFACASSALMIAAVFHRSLGLADSFESLFLLAGLACLACFVYLQRRRARLAAAREPTGPQPNKRWKRFWTMVAVVALGAATFPFLEPYTGVNLSVPQQVFSSVVSFVVFVAIAFFATRKRQDLTAVFRFFIITFAIAAMCALAALYFELFKR
jgi:FtsH-binding integral membrane protein